MDIKERNLKVLKEHRINIYDKLVNHIDKSQYEVTSSDSKEKYPNLLHKKKGLFFYDNTNPLEGTLDKLRKKNIYLPNLNIFLGFGLGYEVITFLQKFANSESHLIVVEKDVEVLLRAIETIDLTKIFSHPKIHFIIDVPTVQVYQILYSILSFGNNKLYLKAMNIIENEISYIENKDYYLSFFSQLRDAVKETMLNFGNDPLDAFIGIENIFSNINEIINNPGINNLYGKFKGVPGIVISTGPSLNKNIELLKGLENKALFCAADASLKVLKKYNLKPHLVTSLERKLPTVKLFEGLTKEDLDGVYLAGCPVIRPEVYENFPGERLIVYRDFATFKWLDIEKGILNIGASAGNMAYKILESLGCDPIILIGQDLAFGDDDTTHAKGFIYGEKEEQYYRPERLLTVEGNYIPEIKTTDVWFKFLKCYEKDISRNPGTVVNATEGGAKIHGAELMKFSEAIEKFINKDHDILNTIVDSIQPPTAMQIEDDLSKTILKVGEALEYCNYVLNQFKNGYELCLKFDERVSKPFKKSQSVDMKEAQKLFNELTAKSSVISDEKFHLILMHYVQAYYLKTMVEIHGIKASEPASMDAHIKIVYYFQDMYKVFIGLIEKILLLFSSLDQNLEN